MTHGKAHPTVLETIATMKRLHKGQKDRGGFPYSWHPLRVMLRLGEQTTDNERHAALLHDVLEDTPTTAADLLLMGYSRQVVGMVLMLTRDKGVVYRDYIQRIGAGPIFVIRVKLADLFDNNSPKRIADLPTYKEMHGMSKRYDWSIKYLTTRLPNHGVVSGDLPALARLVVQTPQAASWFDND
jgi:hypothetical protein